MPVPYSKTENVRYVETHSRASVRVYPGYWGRKY